MTTAPSVAPVGETAERPFWGWRVLAGATLGQLIANAVTFAPFSVFVIPLTEEFEVPRGTIGAGMSLGLLVMAATGVVISRAIDRGYARSVMTLGATISAAGLLAASQVQEIRQLAGVYAGVICVGAAMFGTMPTMAISANWFVRRRGMALGICVAGATLAGFFAPPIAAYLVDSFGWRTTLVYFAIFCLVVGVPAMAGLVVGRPEDVGQTPDGDAPSLAVTSAEADDVDVARILRDPRLWILALGFAFFFASPSSIIVPSL